jgi:hypothetical protein
MDSGCHDYDFLSALRAAAGVAPSISQNENPKKNKRPLFDRIFFHW